MNSLNNRGVHSENLRIFPNYATNKMDYRQKMVVSSAQKLKHEDDDDEDLETLRLAALKSLRAKNTLQSTQQPAVLPQPMMPRVAYPHGPVYNHRGTSKRGYYQNRVTRPNGSKYYHSRVNQNLIEIVPMAEDDELQKDGTQTDFETFKSESHDVRDTEGDSKFYRYKDTASGSEEEDTKESNSASTAALTPKSERLEKVGAEGDESGTERDNQSGMEESPREQIGDEDVCDEEEDEGVDEDEEEEGVDDDEDDDDEEEEEKPANDDDDDVLLMADLEEEDSLERLMDEMEREMNVDKPSERKEKKITKKDARESRKIGDVQKSRNRKSRGERETGKNGTANTAVSTSLQSTKSERRSVSPRSVNRTLHKRRSLSPKPRLRKKSPRRSPRRSPPRQSKKSREMPRLRSPRKMSPPSRFSPRPRSPKLSPRPRSPRLSPRRSPNNRSPMRRSPLRKLSPRGRSPHSRSPRIRRSRSPIAITRSRSPRPPRSPKRSNRSRSPRIIRSRSPRNSPARLSPRARTPRSKSPRLSPLVRRASPRSRSPRLSPRRAASPRLRSPKLSPERRRGSPIRLRSPVRLSPHRSPWSSPKNSPRLSPRRRRSPKESTRKTRPRSITPEESVSKAYKRDGSPARKNASSPDVVRSKVKQRESALSNSGPKDSTETTNNDPVLEARRKKFECNKPIDPIHDNKKIKLGKRDNANKKIEVPEEPEPVDSPKAQKSAKMSDEYEDVAESDLCLTDDYVYEVLEDVVSDESSQTNTVSMCVEMVPVKVEKERSKKKKKRDKEIYQVGKLKSGELTLSERIGKEKKCKKRKDRATSPVDSSPEQATTVVEDLTVDEEGDLRTELSRRRAERLNRAVPIQSARLLQSAFKGVVNEVAKTNAKVIQRHSAKGEEKTNKKEVRRVTVLHRAVTDLPDSEEEAVVDSKVPVRFRLGINKPTQESREPKAARKSSKRQGRKVKHKNNMPLTDHDRKNQ